MQRSRQVILKTCRNERFDADGEIMIARKTNVTSGGMLFELEFRPNGKVLMKNPEEKYLAIRKDDHTSIELSNSDSELAEFDYIPVYQNRFMLRTHIGNYLSVAPDGKLVATFQYMRLAGLFCFSPLNFKHVNPMGIKDHLKQFRRAMRFVLSKVFGKT
jgi:hypothetical protein